MSDDLIRRIDVIEALKDNMVEMGGDDFSEMGVHSDDIDAVINGIPAIEPKRGEWIVHSNGKVCDCSVCNESYDRTFEYVDEWNFCPNCGADMRGPDDED